MRRPISQTMAFALLAVWALAGCASSSSAATTTQATTQTTTQTIARDGGLRATVQVTCPSGGSSCAFSSVFAQTMTALEQRARAGLGAPGATVKRLDGARVEVDVPGYTNEQVGVSALTTQGLVQFIDTGGAPLPVGATVSADQYPVLFTGSQLDSTSVSAQMQPQMQQPAQPPTQQPIVTFAFKGAAATQFAQYTGSHIGQYLTVTLDHRVIESATIQAQISGEGAIYGLKTLADAQTLAACLKSAPLPAPVTLVSAIVVKANGG